MSRLQAILTAAVGALLLGLAGMVGALWLRGQQDTPRAAITSESIVMLGDSITEQGPWETAFPGLPVANRGFSGFTTAQLVDVAREVAADRPLTVYLLTGTNDIRDGHGPEWTVRHLESILDELGSVTPEIVVVIQTVLPRQDHPTEVRATNQAIAELAVERGIEILDLYALFDDGSGGLRSEDTVDGLHLSDAGNRRWADALNEHVRAR